MGAIVNQPKTEYKGGKVEIYPCVDVDFICMTAIKSFAEALDYDSNAKVYFKNNGQTSESGYRLVHDDDSIRDMVKVCLPFGVVEFFVDHVLVNEGGVK